MHRLERNKNCTGYGLPDRRRYFCGNKKQKQGGKVTPSTHVCMCGYAKKRARREWGENIVLRKESKGKNKMKNA